MTQFYHTALSLYPVFSEQVECYWFRSWCFNIQIRIRDACKHLWAPVFSFWDRKAFLSYLSSNPIAQCITKRRSQLQWQRLKAELHLSGFPSDNRTETKSDFRSIGKGPNAEQEGSCLIQERDISFNMICLMQNQICYKFYLISNVSITALRDR